MRSFWVINLMLFQASWLCAALFTQQAALVMPLLLIAHFVLSPTRRQDLKVLLLVPIGIVVDKCQLELGVFSAGNDFFPLWLVYLWAMFILSLNHSLSWLDNCSLFSLVILGAAGGSSSYWGGIASGALGTQLSTLNVVLSLMAVWALLLPVLVKVKYCAIERHEAGD